MFRVWLFFLITFWFSALFGSHTIDTTGYLIFNFVLIVFFCTFERKDVLMDKDNQTVTIKSAYLLKKKSQTISFSDIKSIQVTYAKGSSGGSPVGGRSITITTGEHTLNNITVSDICRKDAQVAQDVLTDIKNWFKKV